MVKHGNDQKLIADNAVDQRERKPAKQHATAVASHDCKHFGVAHGRGYGCVQSPREFKTKTCGARFIPSLRLKRLVSGLRSKEDLHSVVPLKQLGPHFIP
jgi:hypothetical protein